MPEGKTYTSSDLAISEIRKDVSYIREEMRSMHSDLTTGYAPLSRLKAVEDKLALLYRAFAFVLALILAGFFAALSKGIFK